MWYVRIEDAYDDEIGVETLDAHPGQGGDGEEMNESGEETTRTYLNLRDARHAGIDVHRAHGDKGDV